MMDRIRLAWVLVALLACSLTFADRAQAAEHLMHVNEVMLSTGGDSNAQFIELFDPASESFPNAPYRVEVYDAAGAVLGLVDIGTPTTGAPILISTAAADAALGTTGDFVLPVALPTAGQACFVTSTDRQAHCVAWGCVTAAITGADTAPSPPDGMSIQRQAAGGAWQLATPTPEAANSTGTDEAACPGAVDAGPGGTDAGPAVDAGTDAGPPVGTDSGPPVGTDSGPSGTDSGPSGTDAGMTGDDGGCSIGHSKSSPLGLLLLFGAIVLWRGRRRR